MPLGYVAVSLAVLLALVLALHLRTDWQVQYRTSGQHLDPVPGKWFWEIG